MKTLKRGDTVEFSKFVKFLTFFIKGMKRFRNNDFVIESIENDISTIRHNGRAYKAPQWAYRKKESTTSKSLDVTDAK